MHSDCSTGVRAARASSQPRGSSLANIQAELIIMSALLDRYGDRLLVVTTLAIVGSTLVTMGLGLIFLG
jgi:hypothetical protein